MKLYIEGQEIVYENEIEKIDVLIEDIYKILESHSKILEFLDIDGEKVYVDFGEYILKNLSSIEAINVKALKITELIESTLITTLDYISNAEGPLKSLINKIDYLAISDLMEGLTWILETFIYIDQDLNISFDLEKRERWNIYARDVYSLGSIMKDIMIGMQGSNDNKLKDIISKDIIPLFNSMEKNILEIIRID